MKNTNLYSVAALLLALGFAAGSVYTTARFDHRINSLEKRLDEPRNVVTINRTERDLTALFEQVDQSVVSVRTFGEKESSASGFVYRSDGYIVTNQHVVEGASRVEVTLADGRVKNAEVVGTDVYSDLAVLKIDAKNLDPLPLANSSQVEVGQRAVAIGNPFRLSGTMTYGIISQKDRLLQVEGGFSIPNVLQTDAAINPGNSGGPLLNMQGEVVGVNTAIKSSTNTFSGVGFAVPSNKVKRVVPELIKDGDYEHSWIGVRGRDLTSDMIKAMEREVESGFMILSVVENSPADRAGLQGTRQTAIVDGREVPVGGDVIVAIDGRKVRGISDILNYLGEETEPGDRITLTVIRDGRRIKVPLTLSSREQSQGR
ncbi:MAG: S1C family serine protease [Candidatus Nanohaloarchaea archaeon]